MTTRLDRLFLLLDTGSTPVIRRSAAEQLGQVQKLHPHEINNLLTKVHHYLNSTNWDTRIAASHAVEAIAKNVPQWRPTGAAKKEEEEEDSVSGEDLLKLHQFDIQKVLSHGASLLASEGNEYDLEEEESSLEDKDRLHRQKVQLNKRLGLDVAGGLGLSADDFYREEDLVIKRESSADRESAQNRTGVKDLLQQQMRTKNGSELSSRELNRAKRKAKLMAKQVSRDDGKNGDNDGEPSSKLRKTASVMVEQPGEDKVVIDNIPDIMADMDEMEDWPFDGFCEVLMNDLFSPSWEKRHGAATGLRGVMKIHGGGAGRTSLLTQRQMEQSHMQWVEDLAVRLICVMALDRFGDFISDEVVAPVRETCAQTLGVIMRLMSAAHIEATMRILIQLLGTAQWEVRHGGLLGIKYLLAVRKDVTDTLLPAVLPSVFGGLQDRADDVRAVAAAALSPVSDALVRSQAQRIPQIVECLWSTLLDLDDLTASTNSIMGLLSSLLAHPSVQADSVCGNSLAQLVPRLWPFLRHNIAPVRKAALQTLCTLLNRFHSQGAVALWLLPILADATRHVFQRVLLEEKQDILDVIVEVWQLLLSCCPADHVMAAASPWLGMWLCLTMQPATLPFDPSLLIEAKHTPKEQTPWRHAVEQQQLQEQEASRARQEYIGGHATTSLPPPERDMAVVRARLTAARLLGQLCGRLAMPMPNVPEGVENPRESLDKLLVYHLSSKSALQRIVMGHVLAQWVPSEQAFCCSADVKTKLHECLLESIYFDEMALTFTRMQTECQDFVASLKQQRAPLENVVLPGCNLPVDEAVTKTVLSPEQALNLAGAVYDSVRQHVKPRYLTTFDERRRQLMVTVTQTTAEQQLLTIRVQLSLAGAAICLDTLPDKMNPVVRPLMEAVKKEQNEQLQRLAASYLSRLVELCTGRNPCPTPKIVKNLCTMLCSDPCFTPAIGNEAVGIAAADLCKEAIGDKYLGILTLHAQQVILEPGRGRRSSTVKKPMGLNVEISLESITQEEDEAQKQLLIQRRGATLSLCTMVRDVQGQLLQKLPTLWEAMTAPLGAVADTDLERMKDQDEEAQTLVNSLQLLEVLGPSLHSSLHPQLVERLPALSRCLGHPYTAVRHLASRCLGMLSKVVTIETMNHVLEEVLHLLDDSDSELLQQGAMETIANIIEQLGMDVVCYIVLLVVPVLGRMSDASPAVRLMATHCFATLIRLIPLEAGIPDPPAMKESLVRKKDEQRTFLEQLMDGSKVDNYKVPIAINAQLRKYQQDGVNWLAFLNKYKLHGILCDDMGLGKTLMSICLMAGDDFNRAERYKLNAHPECRPLPSIVVCPPTLTGHWVYEVEKFVSSEHLNPLHYTGPPAERHRLQKKVKKHNLVIASYDVVRNDIDFFGGIKWNYCILDEGHIIKNSKTKISKAVKQLVCNHRLILSGTPIQNNVLELWSLLDFLMPGFLGTERQFQARYGKPILQSRDAKSSSKEQEAGALAMESLHRQVLPFLLRRLKEDVLQDLPPKIIQDYYCDLSPLQVQLYEDFARSRAKRSLDEDVHEAEEKEKLPAAGTSHIFQALQYLRKLCNHPALVLTKQHPQHDTVTAQLRRQSSSLRDLQHAPKLTALKQLLTDCGIGLGAGSEADEAPVVNQHRVLIFCQLKSMLDMVEKDLLKCQMPSVSYLRLDGGVPAGNRHGIVHRFNNDPSIDVLLLTTHVGGLGLNLTGADTVVFVEHDWNPMKDLQAMDRAHRIGQKKVVNVYRLITRGTLEEKIMGLQKFKMNIANSVISQENSSLASMGTDQLLDLFALDDSSKKHQVTADKSDQSEDVAQKQTMKTILDNLEDLWDGKQYENEYNLDNFMQTLSKTDK